MRYAASSEKIEKKLSLKRAIFLRGVRYLKKVARLVNSMRLCRSVSCLPKSGLYEKWRRRAWVWREKFIESFHSKNSKIFFTTRTSRGVTLTLKGSDWKSFRFLRWLAEDSLTEQFFLRGAREKRRILKGHIFTHFRAPPKHFLWVSIKEISLKICDFHLDASQLENENFNSFHEKMLRVYCLRWPWVPCVINSCTIPILKWKKDRLSCAMLLTWVLC